MGWRRRNDGLSLVQCPSIAYGARFSSAARRARVGSARAGPRPQRERAPQWRASALHAQATTRSEREGWHVGRRGIIERARWDGATLNAMSRRRRAREAGASPQARWGCCSPIDGGTTRFARDCQCSASARYSSLSLGTRPITGASAARARRRAGDTRAIRYGRALHEREAAVPSAPGPCSHGPALPLTARGGLRV